MALPYSLHAGAAALALGTLAGLFLTAGPTGVGFLLVTAVVTVALAVAFLVRRPADPLQYAATAWGLGIVLALVLPLASLALGPTEGWLPYDTVRVPLLSRTSPYGWLAVVLAVGGAYVVEYRGGRERLRELAGR